MANFVSLSSPGVFGVALFFIISGFIIPLSAERGFNLRDFIIRRVLRIFPLCLASFLVVAVIGYGLDLPEFRAVRSAGVGTWIANIFLIQDYVNAPPLLNVTWTLSLEFAWYALFAIAFLMMGPRFDDRLIVLAPIAIIVLTIGSMWLQHRIPLGRIGMIYLAILGCRFYRYHVGAITRRRLFLDVFVFLCISVVSNAVAFGYFKHPNITMMQAVVPWTAAVIVFLVVFTNSSLLNAPILNSGIFVWLGTISFSTYLLHLIALAIANAYTPASISLAAGWIGTLVLSAVGYYLVEVPSQDLARKLTRRQRPVLA